MVVCSKVGEDAKQYIIKRPQVVNGAQTIGSLYEEFKNNLTQQKLKDSKVLCKIIETTDQDLISHICETSNTQKAVALVDLRTNDLFQKELEHYFKIKGKYHYNRKGDKAPKEYKNLPYANFYQWCHSAFNEKPAEAKNAKNLLFSLDEHGQYEDLNRKISFNINHLTRLCDIAFVVNEYIRSDTSKTEKGLMRIMSLHIIAGMYYINSDTKTDFKKIYSILYKSYKKQVKSDENLDANKVFTKSEIAWNDLKIKLNSKYVTRKS